MNPIFADAVYWIALTNPKDQWHETAIAARNDHPADELVTTEDVLVEVLTYFGGYGPDVRRTAAQVVRTILGDAGVEIVPHDSDMFVDGLALYESRLDKSYSMVDCMSMQVMWDRDLQDVLTHDQHFQQEGFNLLF